MKINFNVTGDQRKALVKSAAEILGQEPAYKGAPSFAYTVDDYTIDKAGTLTYDDLHADLAEVKKLLTGLTERGFEHATQDVLTIEVPKDGFTEAAINNLEKLVMSKASLIKKAIGQNQAGDADALPVEQTEATLRFPWFRFGASAEEVNAYARFISALCAAAKEQQRVNAKEKPVENEKFEFRVFLVRLGFVGDEYKSARKILLSKLDGNSAFKKGAPVKTEEAADE